MGATLARITCSKTNELIQHPLKMPDFFEIDQNVVPFYNLLVTFEKIFEYG